MIWGVSSKGSPVPTFLQYYLQQRHVSDRKTSQRGQCEEQAPALLISNKEGTQYVGTQNNDERIRGSRLARAELHRIPHNGEADGAEEQTRSSMLSSSDVQICKLFMP